MSETRRVLSRREALVLCAGAGAGLLTPRSQASDQAAPTVAAAPLRTRPIPHGTERLPVVGLGTAIVFDVGPNLQERAGCSAVVRALVAHGASLIDTAPSYGSAEEVVGATLTDTGLRDKVFLATKLELPGLALGDVIAIENSGAYGLTSSPTRFISHPEPREAMLEGGRLTDVSESLLNHWRLADN